MTTASHDRAGNLCCSADARVGPDYRILNPCSFLNETSRAQDRINYLRTRLDLTVVADYRQLIDLRRGR